MGVSSKDPIAFVDSNLVLGGLGTLLPLEDSITPADRMELVVIHHERVTVHAVTGRRVIAETDFVTVDSVVTGS